MVGGDARFSMSYVSSFSMVVKNGRLVVPLEVIRHMNREGSLHLVRKFLRARPDMDSIKCRDISRWNPKGSLDLVAMPNGFFMIKLVVKEDKERIFNGGPWMLGNRTLFFRN